MHADWLPEDSAYAAAPIIRQESALSRIPAGFGICWELADAMHVAFMSEVTRHSLS